MVGGGPASRHGGRQSGDDRRAQAWIVMGLLIASTVLALYDLWLLATIFMGVS